MGLDVYLEYFSRPIDMVLAAEQAGSDKAEEIWASEMKKLGKADYRDLTKVESGAIRAQTVKLYSSLGLDEYGAMIAGREEVRIDSSEHPEHMFKIGYFRSSYNDGGLNHLLRSAMEGRDLYWIFEPPQDGGYFKPDWCKARTRANKVLGDLRKYAREEGWAVHSANLHFDSANLPSSSEEALAAFRAEIESHEKRSKASPPPPIPSFRAYSSLKGEFNLDGEPTFALIPGAGVLGRPCVYVITKAEDLEWYVKALEIVVETCDYVLKQKSKCRHRLCWSS